MKHHPTRKPEPASTGPHWPAYRPRADREAVLFAPADDPRPWATFAERNHLQIEVVPGGLMLTRATEAH